jgi:hypothetical protein
MGVLYARVAGAWVPVIGNAGAIAPAEAGPRDDAATVARFGHVSGDGRVGFMGLNTNDLQIIMGNAKSTALYQLNAAGTGYEQFGGFASAASQLNGVGITNLHPGGGSQAGFYPHAGAYSSSSTYMLMSDNYVLINALSDGVYLRKAGVNIAQFGSGDTVSLYKHANTQTMTATGQIRANKTSYAWNEAALLGAATISTEPSALSLWSSYAPIQRVVASVGEAWEYMGSTGAYYVPLRASAFTVVSSITTKRDVRSLRPERERIVVRHEPFCDRAPKPDIMALRPVAFRPKAEPPRRYNSDDPDDWEHDPPDSPIGVQARRERLGLIAEEVQHVIPSAISYDVDGAAKAIDYAQITVALLDHVQALTEEVATLRYRITELEAS